MVHANMGTNADMHTERQSLRKGKKYLIFYFSEILGAQRSLFKTLLLQDRSEFYLRQILPQKVQQKVTTNNKINKHICDIFYLKLLLARVL